MKYRVNGEEREYEGCQVPHAPKPVGDNGPPIKSMVCPQQAMEKLIKQLNKDIKWH